MHIHEPYFDGSEWRLIISENISPLSTILETFRFSTRERAYQYYRRIKKETGRGL